MTTSKVVDELIQAGDLNKALTELRPWVVRLARDHRRKLPHAALVDVDDLVQAALLATWRAMKRWDHRSSFMGYVYARVIGSFTDETRALDEVSRHMRRQILNGQIHHQVVDDQELEDLAQEEPYLDPVDADLIAHWVKQVDFRLTSRYPGMLTLWLRGETGASLGKRYGVSECWVVAIVKQRVQQVREAVLGVDA